MADSDDAVPAARGTGSGKAAGAAALGTELDALTRMNSAALRVAWRRLFRMHPPNKLSREMLRLGVAWKLQERALGGLSVVVRRQLTETAQTLASKSDLAEPRKLMLKPGARLMRAWGGETHEVEITEAGFVWRGRTWNSLSAIAREITGVHWSGPRFFGLNLARPLPSSDRQTTASG